MQASLGTTKYCSYFLKSMQCPKPDCMYLHELGDEAASFTKEEMQVNKHLFFLSVCVFVGGRIEMADNLTSCIVLGLGVSRPGHMCPMMVTNPVSSLGSIKLIHSDVRDRPDCFIYSSL